MNWISIYNISNKLPPILQQLMLYSEAGAQELEELVAPGGAPGASRAPGERGTLDKTSLIR